MAGFADRGGVDRFGRSGDPVVSEPELFLRGLAGVEVAESCLLDAEDVVGSSVAGAAAPVAVIAAVGGDVHIEDIHRVRIEVVVSIHRGDDDCMSVMGLSRSRLPGGPSAGSAMWASRVLPLPLAMRPMSRDDAPALAAVRGAGVAAPRRRIVPV